MIAPKPADGRKSADYEKPAVASKNTNRPTALSVNNDADSGNDGQPRIGPVPPTPSKRKAPPIATQHSNPSTAQPSLPYKRAKFGDLAITMRDDGSNGRKRCTFRFLDLPAELRNKIYCMCIDMSRKQALVIHRPRMATLRSSTRQVRAAPGRYREPEDLDNKKGPSKSIRTTPKETHRPFVSLTQVNQQIRREFYTTYMSRQEIGMDFTDCSKYMRTFFNPEQPMCWQGAPDSTGKNMPFQGNLTIAVSRQVLPVEKKQGWIDALPLLSTWANSVHIEAGFGRYSAAGYVPQRDGESKDLYRLYGRRVLPDRSCTNMNIRWRVVLRSRHLAAVRIVRESRSVDFVRPYIHLIWKYEAREPWMTRLHSPIPGSAAANSWAGNWLWDMGFDNMEYFEVRVGAETYHGEIYQG